MTLVIATAAGDTGYLSLDTLWYSFHAFEPLEFPPLDGTRESAFVAAWSGDGTPPKVDPIDFAPKVHAFPHLKMAAGFAGYSSVGLAWIDYLRRSDVRGMDELDDIAPGILPQIAAQFTGHSEAGVFHVGWSEREGQVVGRVFRTYNGWQCECFTHGTLLGTPVHPDFAGYDEVISAVDTAAKGIGVEAFHAAVARNIEDAYRAGKALRWLHYGGELLTAKVDRNGVTIRPTYTFKGHAPLNVLALDYRQDIAERLALAQIASLKGPMGQEVVRRLIAQNSTGGALSSMVPTSWSLPSHRSIASEANQ